MQRNMLEAFNWTPQPAPAALVQGLIDAFCQKSATIHRLAARMRNETGTRLVAWIDHIALPNNAELEGQPIAESLPGLGFEPCDAADHAADGVVWRHRLGMFPPLLRLSDAAPWRLALKVESVADFLEIHQPEQVAQQSTDPASPPRGLRRLRMERVASESGVELLVVERHGWPGFEPPGASAQVDQEAGQRHAAAFRTRRRDFPTESAAFDHAGQLVAAAVAELGVDLACDLFFAAERDYWQWRNRAAQVQRIRQDSLGLGWANHDHHTYRSSRAHFTRLIAILEQLGFVLRERFYGGHGAGWGAQVLEQPRSGVVIFADVDLTPEELSGDFAHEPLPARRELGTVGLWCRLHGEAFLQAGMHHLECQFDFDSARQQLAELGVAPMKPFTDFAFLKQAFTQGDNWPVAPWRIAQLQHEGLITADQAARFRREGALGSHLEILQRDDGYKGFNQTGISEIIRHTDPRGQA